MNLLNHKIVFQISQIIAILFSVLLIGLGIFTLSSVSRPLFKLSVNEINKSQVIGMLPEVPIEFDAKGKNFWWLQAPSESILFLNDSDEDIDGILKMYFEMNPCKNNRRIELQYEQNKIIQDVNNLNVTVISLPVTINEFSEIKIEIAFENEQDCVLTTGDNRLFGAKLVSWSFL
jgi:hypothetical protein